MASTFCYTDQRIVNHIANEYSWGTCRTAYDLLSLGFTSVVGVQSSIRAEGAATFSRAFYKSLMWRSGLDFTDAHLALHSAAVEIREEGRKDIHLADWVRYIHVGI